MGEDEAYGRFLSSAVAPRMRHLGFRRSNSNFFLPPNPPAENWVLVYFQSTRGEGRRQFTVNLGVISPRLLRLEKGWLGEPPLAGRLPKRRQVQLEYRLEGLIPTNEPEIFERWWDIADGASVAELEAEAAQIVQALVDHGLPHLSPLLSDRGVRDYIDALTGPWGLPPIEVERLLMLLRDIGPSDDVTKVLAEAERRSPMKEQIQSEIRSLFDR